MDKAPDASSALVGTRRQRQKPGSKRRRASLQPEITLLRIFKHWIQINLAVTIVPFSNPTGKRTGNSPFVRVTGHRTIRGTRDRGHSETMLQGEVRIEVEVVVDHAPFSGIHPVPSVFSCDMIYAK